jgi:hypothetical protein
MKHITNRFLGIGALLAIVGSCISLKPNQVYLDTFDPRDTVFYNSAEIYSDYLTSEAWSSKAEKRCLHMEAITEATYQGSLGIRVKWNKTGEGCPWLGIGFGWDNWTAKNISKIKNTGAVQFYVRTKEGSLTNLPMAFGLEDYTGAQAWLGMDKKAIKAEKITTDWTRIELPLCEFDWDEQNANATAIKQILMQFEAEGELYIDEIEIVPYSGGFRKRLTLSPQQKATFKANALKDEPIWTKEPELLGNKAKCHVSIQDSALCLAVEVKDATPLQNPFKGKNQFKGDGFEITFSTKEDAARGRKRLLYSDQHLAFFFSQKVTAYNVRQQKPLTGVTTATRPTDSGYLFEAKIPFKALGFDGFKPKYLYGLEMALNLGGEENRKNQLRWNTPQQEGFADNPGLWGELYIKPAPINTQL